MSLSYLKKNIQIIWVLGQSITKINDFKTTPYLGKKRKIIINFCTQRLQRFYVFKQTIGMFLSPLRFGMQPVPQKWAVLIVCIQCCLQTLTVVSKLMTTLWLKSPKNVYFRSKYIHEKCLFLKILLKINSHYGWKLP